MRQWHGDLADCQSAIQQTTSLRYKGPVGNADYQSALHFRIFPVAELLLQLAHPPLACLFSVEMPLQFLVQIL
jgi:hypothetical protein